MDSGVSMTDLAKSYQGLLEELKGRIRWMTRTRFSCWKASTDGPHSLP